MSSNNPETGLNQDIVDNEKRISHPQGKVESDTRPGEASCQQLQNEAWNHPRSNIARIAACFWSLLILGSFDSAYGALLPYLQDYYHLSYTVISIVFFSPLVGYVLSGLLNTRMHNIIGQRGIAMLCGGSHMLSAIINCLHPPYPVLVISFMLAGFGNGLSDSAWNAWVGDLERANELLGFMHSCYGVGAVISPLIATSLVTKADLGWYTYYYVVTGLTFIELLLLTATFWNHTGIAYREKMSKRAVEGQREASMRQVLTNLLEARPAWLSALFVLVYVGVEVSIGGWIVEFMLEIRHGAAFASGMVSTGYWLGMTVGRSILPFVTRRLGVKAAVAIYIILAMALELIFWLVPHFIVSAIVVAFQGFFIGPLFPTAITAVTRLLPEHLYVVVIGFVAALGGCGASLLPFAVGALAQRFGVTVLQPVILGLLGLSLLIWLSLPRIPSS